MKRGDVWEAPLAVDKTSVKTWDDIENEFDEKMVDSATGLPIPP
eukprot:COSAG05_NODE_11646_length_503_cov_1.660891_1_plen_43_part_01